jgi:hypothetical protein
MIYKGKLCYPEAVERLSKDKFRLSYHYYFMDPDERVEAGTGLPRVGVVAEVTSDIEEFEPYFPDSQFYQLTNTVAYWLSRKSERSRRKGMNLENSEFLYIGHIMDKVRETNLFRAEFLAKDVARIFYNKLPKVIGEDQSVEEVLAKLHTKVPAHSGFSLALSKNIALVSSDFEIPVVFYKLAPVGYFMDNKVLIKQKNMSSIETIQEETNLRVETY